MVGMEGNQLLTAAEAATTLKISKRTILKWAREGKIESEKISRKVVLFTEEAIDRFLKSTRTGIQLERTNHQAAGRKMTSPQPKKGGSGLSSRESWRSLRQEVASCQ